MREEDEEYEGEVQRQMGTGQRSRQGDLRQAEGEQGAAGAINRLKQDTDKITKEETALKSDRIEVDQQLQKYDEAIRDNNKKVKYWKNEMRKLQLQDVPGEPMPVLPELTEEDVAAIDMDDLQFELNQIDENLAKTKPNMAAINEYKKKEEVRSCSRHIVG